VLGAPGEVGRVMLDAERLVKHYPVRGGGVVHAVEDVSLSVRRGSTLGIVGESGCGKSTTARLLSLLEQPTSGSVRLDGRDVISASSRDLRALRKRVQMVFQDPYSSLNPRMRVGDMLAEVLRVHGLADSRRAERHRAAELLDMVGLREGHLDRHPHQFSGGQRQRIVVARALAVEPEILVLDEPVSALDVSVRSEIMNLLRRLRAELDLTYVFISHDLGMIRFISDDVAVMYLGKVVEQGGWRSVTREPLHPYTRALLNAVPVPDPIHESERQIVPLAGEPPDPVHPPMGCNFNTRCPLAEEVCFDIEPQLVDMVDGHRAACHVAERELRSGAA
jgi:oligopeptide transport system ATP-binding protein